MQVNPTRAGNTKINFFIDIAFSPLDQGFFPKSRTLETQEPPALPPAVAAERTNEHP
jgi:hypothetical protein